MYACRWAYCATICGNLDELDEHIFKHIDTAPTVVLSGVKRRKISRGTWVKLDGGRSESGVSGSQEGFQRLSDILPVHASQAGDTSIASDTTHPIPSFQSLPHPPSFPSPPRASQFGGQSAPGANASADVNMSELEDAEITEEMLREYFRSPTGTAERSSSLKRGSGRSTSPFIPPTQAHPTQSQARAQAPSSSNEQPLSQPSADPLRSQSTQGSQPSQGSVEIGRAGLSDPIDLSPPDLLARSAMPPPPAPIPASNHRESAVRRPSVSRPLLFGSAVGSAQTPGSPNVVVNRDVSGGTPIAGGPRRSVGFSFGSLLGSGSDEQSK